MITATSLRARGRVVAALTVLLLSAAACSSSSTSTSAASTDSGRSGSGTATDTASSGKKVTKSDLEALLPSASSVGSSYREDTSSSASDSTDSSGGSDSFQKAAEKQCPQLAKLSKGNVPDSEKATRTYRSSDGSSIEVSLNPKAKSYSSDELDKQIQAVNDCGEIKASISGNDAKIRFSVKRDDSLGDQGLVINVTIDVGVAELNQAFTIKTVGYDYRVGSVGVEVSSSGDIDQQTLTAVPPDGETAKSVAEDLEPKVKKLVNG